MNKNVEVKISKSGHPIPLVDGIHLHSIYNPQKEAEGFTLSNEKKLEETNRILIFGLGFGYHIEAIEKRLKYRYPKGYEVVVIEPNQATFNNWKELKPVILSSRVRVVCLDTIDDYFKDRLLLDFLVLKPSVISHTASFELHEDFYKSFMCYQYAKDTSSSAEFVEDKKLHEYLLKEDATSTQDLLEKTHGKSKLSEWDFITMSLGVINEND
jgi:hypothetical protein